MYKITIASVGKTKESWLQEGINSYEQRLKGTVAIEWLLARDNEQLVKLTGNAKSILCLDVAGKIVSSEDFSKTLYKALQDGGARLTIVIGNANGLPKQIVGKFPSVSLSRLTFTHQMTRLILMEQLYRSVEIARGSPYHR